MGWSAAQRTRLEQERTILRHYFPNLQWHHPTEPSKVYLDGPFTTNAGGRYSLRIFIPEVFPAVCPDMIVSRPRPLRALTGEALDEANPSMHVLGTRDGGTKICHFRHSRWVPENTLYLVALKGRIWLEAYEAHRRTGKPLDRFLRHMAEDPESSSSSYAADEEENTFLRLLRRLFD